MDAENKNAQDQVDVGGASNDVGTNNDSQNPQDNSGSSGEKTFTQAEVNRMMKQEKESGRRSILKELGVTDIKSASDSLKKYQEYLDSQKTELQRAQEKYTEAASLQQAAEQKANRMENCLKAIELGALPGSAAELVTIASAKVTEDKDLSAVITEMKSSSVYAGFFSKSADVGTGNSVKNHPAQGARKDGESIGKSLAQKQNQKEKKNKYFNLT